MLSPLTLTLLALKRLTGVGDQRAIQAVASDQGLQLPTHSYSPAPRKRAVGTSTLIASDPHAYERALRWAEAQHRQHEERGARIIGYFDEDYPHLLRSIPRAPAVLFCMGDLTPLLTRPQLAIVGTRTPSSAGRERAQLAAMIASAHHLGVISGLALGIDTCAHQATLEREGYTVAILGHGLDRVYPAPNTQLAEQILESGGLLLSEQPWGTPLHPSYLVQRDRLQSGFADAVFIAESRDGGGALHAGRAALSQGRPLLLPHGLRAQLSDPLCQREEVMWIADQDELQGSIQTIASQIRVQGTLALSQTERSARQLSLWEEE